MTYQLGVDLGTTFTAAAVATAAGPTMVGLGNRALQVPSVLFRTDDGFLVGESAERRGLSDPDRVVREFKRRLGDDVPVVVDGASFAPEDLMARLLAWVLERTAERMGGRPDTLVLTHPASWQEHKLERLRVVVDRAGAPPAGYCPEPTAAAAQYASRSRVAPGDRLAVYDLGGGTFDVCVLEQTSAGFAVLGTPEGVEHLGGVDFDALLLGHVLQLLGDRVPVADPDDATATSAFHRLRRDCVDAKEALSGDVETTVPVALPGLVTSVRVTRAEFEALIRPGVEQSLDAMARALRWADVRPADLTAIILVGGSSRIPLVGELLQAAFGVPVALDTHPKHDVVLGALQEAASRAERGGTPHGRRPVRPPTVSAAAGQRPTSDPSAAPGSDGHEPVQEPHARRHLPGVTLLARPRSAVLALAALLVVGLVVLVVGRGWAGRPAAEPPATATATATATTPATTPPLPRDPCLRTEEFDSPTLARPWQRTQPDAPLTLVGGVAVLTAADGADLYQDRVGAPLLVQPVDGDFTIETTLEAAPRQFYQGAGLVLHSGPADYVRLELGFVDVQGIAFEYRNGGPHLRVHSPRRGPDLVQVPAEEVVLQLSRQGRTVTGRWRPRDEPGFRELGSISVSLPSTLRAGVSVLNRAQAGARPEDFEARFDRVVISC